MPPSGGSPRSSRGESLLATPKHSPLPPSRRFGTRRRSAAALAQPAIRENLFQQPFASLLTPSSNEAAGIRPRPSRSQRREREELKPLLYSPGLRKDSEGAAAGRRLYDGSEKPAGAPRREPGGLPLRADGPERLTGPGRCSPRDIALQPETKQRNENVTRIPKLSLEKQHQRR